MFETIMKVLVTGGRRFIDRNFIYSILNNVNKMKDKITVLVHGDCPTGADRIADDWAKLANVPVEKYPAEWDKYGYPAGRIRNIQMLERSKPDMVISFPGETGTEHMTRIAIEGGYEVFIPIHPTLSPRRI